ncbi:MAG: OmpA family protein [Bacteroidota bacterium]
MLLVPMSLWGQSTKLDKTLDKADQYYSQNNKLDASNLYQDVLAQDPNNYHAAYRLGLINRFFKEYSEALRYFRKASEIDPARNDTVYLQIGLTYKILGNYRKAKEAFGEFQQRHPNKNDQIYKRATIELEGCELAEEALSNKPLFRTQPASFNSEAGDRFPSFLDQRQEDVFLAFTSSRPLPNKRNKRNVVTGEPKDEDIYLVVRENDSTFGTEVERINNKKINTKKNNGSATFSGDGLTMYFTICGSKNNRNGCSIFESRYDPVKKKWAKPVFMESVNGTRTVIDDRGRTRQVPAEDRQPFITRDGRTLFFVSDREGGEGRFDIWYSRRVGAGWSTPQNLGPAINTPYNEYSPFFNDPGNTLYFATDGRPGFGGLDIFMAEGTIDNWNQPENVGYPVNSSFDDFGSIWTDEDSLLYFSSDRRGGFGSYDIYWARRIPVDLGSLNVTVTGVIRDKRTQEPVEFATATLFEYQNDGSLNELETFTTDQSAEYDFRLRPDRKYKILGNAREYLANEEEVSTMGLRKNETFIRNIDIELEPIILVDPITIQNIYYDFDEYYLRPDALPELEKLVKLLNDNDNITIQLGSHTDSNGTPEYNDNLSNNRAKAVVKFLADNGINPSRLSWYGYGERNLLIYPEQNDQDEQDNRRTEFRILSIEFNSLNQ